jgi:hypothetical protein
MSFKGRRPIMASVNGEVPGRRSCDDFLYYFKIQSKTSYVA